MLSSINYNGKTIQAWAMITLENTIAIYENKIMDGKPIAEPIDLQTLKPSQISKIIKETL